jgi:hypothetical protein|eukprot:g36.t1
MTFDDIHDYANTTSVMHEIEDKLEHLGSTQAVLLLVLGATLLLFGKKFMGLTLFSAGFVTAGYAFFCSFVYAGDAAGNLSTDGLAYGALATGLVGGLLGGLLAAKIVPVGLFLVGAGGGASIATYFQHIVFAEIFSDAASIPTYAPYVFIIGCAVLGGLLLATLKDKLYCMIASILGAFCVTQGWVYFAKYPNLIDIVEGHVDDTDVNAERVWTEIASIVALSVLGTLYQWGLFGAVRDCLCCRSKQRSGNDMEQSLMRSRVPDDTFV